MAIGLDAKSEGAPASSELYMRYKICLGFALAFVRDPLACVATLILVTIIAVAIFAPWIVPQNPYDLASLDMLDGGLEPGSASSTDSTYWLGTDEQGRDMLSAIAYGLRISLTIGLSSVAIALTIGALVGLVAAYVGGRTENTIMRLVDFQLSFPAILVALIVLTLLGKGLTNVVLAIVIVEWATYARLMRGAVLSERRKEYIEAAQCLALPPYRIALFHLLPNSITPVLVIATIQVGRAIGLEATMSFLGVGVPVTEPSLGMLIANGYPYMLSGKFWISFYPGIALLVAVTAINLFGDRVRDVINPRSS